MNTSQNDCSSADADLYMKPIYPEKGIGCLPLSHSHGAEIVIGHYLIHLDIHEKRMIGQKSCIARFLADDIMLRM